MSGITLRERWQNIVDDWGGKRKEVRYTAVGWQPDAGYIEAEGPTPSGEREFYRVIREAPKAKEVKEKVVKPVTERKQIRFEPQSVSLDYESAERNRRMKGATE